MARLNAGINNAMAAPDVMQQLAIEGAIATPNTPPAVGAWIAREIPRRAEAVGGNVKPD